MRDPIDHDERNAQALRKELLEETAQLRNELLKATNDLRSDLLKETAELRNGLLEETAELRQVLRHETQTGANEFAVSTASDSRERAAGRWQAELRAPDSLSPQGKRVWEYFERGRREYLQGVEEGVVVLTNPRDIRGLLRKLTEGATEEILAVDHIAIENWFRIDLKRYLDLQLGKARNGLRLQRIRLFDPVEMANRDQRDLVRAFLQMHRAVGAELILCPLDDDMRAKFDNLVFFPRKGSFPRTGCLLIDKDAGLTSFRGIVGESGFITTAEVDLIPNHPARRCVEDYEELLGEIKRELTHERTLQALASPETEGEDIAAPTGLPRRAGAD